MSNLRRLVTIAALVLAVTGVLFVKRQAAVRSMDASGRASSMPAGEVIALVPTSTNTDPLPRLVDLGAGKCVPCKLMAPILQQLRVEYAGELVVEFVDVWENREAGEKYKIQSIPTQIFYDSTGDELFRHEGFMSKEDILAKWAEFGFALTPVESAAETRPSARTERSR